MFSNAIIPIHNIFELWQKQLHGQDLSDYLVLESLFDNIINHFTIYLFGLIFSLFIYNSELNI